MAGIKGMKHKRPKTREERDDYALNKIEHLLDSVIFNGKQIAAWDQTRMAALKIRYDKLRATKSESEITDRREKWSDYVKRMQNQSVAAQPQPEQPVAQEPSPETPVVH